MRVKEIVGSAGYLVSEDGRVLYPTGHVTAGRADDKGYLRVEIKYVDGKIKTVKVHRLVAEAFCERAAGEGEVNHKDSNKANNNYKNLEWCTHECNMQHYYEQGNVVVLRGEQHGRAKLTEESVVEIKKLISSGMKSREISKKFPVTEQMIYRIKKGLAWSHING